MLTRLCNFDNKYLLMINTRVSDINRVVFTLDKGHAITNSYHNGMAYGYSLGKLIWLFDCT